MRMGSPQNNFPFLKQCIRPLIPGGVTCQTPQTSQMQPVPAVYQAFVHFTNRANSRFQYLTNCTLKNDAFISLPRSALAPIKTRSDNQPKSNAVFYTPLRVIWHFCAPPVWQYKLKATQPRMNHQTVPRRCYCGRKPAHRFFTHTTEYLLNHKITHCSTYTTPDLPTTLAARLAICKAIHSNKYRPLKSS